MSLAGKIFQAYGPRLYSVIREDPYQLADDIPGVGFKLADEIAERVGIFTDSDQRIRCGLLYTLLQAVGNGHTFLPQEELLAQASELLKVDRSLMEKHLMDMQIDKRIVVKEGRLQGRPTGPHRDVPGGGGQPPAGHTMWSEDLGQEDLARSAEPDRALSERTEDLPGVYRPMRAVYAAQYYYLELNTAKMLHDLNIHGDIPRGQIDGRLQQIEQDKFNRLLKGSSINYSKIDIVKFEDRKNKSVNIALWSHETGEAYSIQIYSFKGDNLEKTSKYDRNYFEKVEEYYKKLIDRTRETPKYLYYLIDAECKCGKKKEAIENINKALQHSNPYPSIEELKRLRKRI